MQKDELDTLTAFREIEKAIKSAVHKSHDTLRDKLIGGVKTILEEYEEEREDTALSERYLKRLGLSSEEMLEIPKGMSPVDYYLQEKSKAKEK
ncbi:hypothetical protein C1N61_32710 (plasmid) [Priestia aryabhattai]